jgi:mRNA interferase YafQ
MYRKLIRTKTFIKDHSKVKWTDQHYTKFIIYIGKLLEKDILPPEAIDHQLKGEWADFREFHISGDLLVVYHIDEDIIYLTRIGTHSQIFG